jgi:nucleotide-binding universal stress UspA family protein
MAVDDRHGSVKTAAAMDGPEAEASCRDVMGASFPFRDFLVARTYEPPADAAATLVARALADRMAGVVVVRAEGESLERQARHAALVVVGSPFPPGTFDADRPRDQVAVRALLGDVARRAGRWAPGAACVRVIDGAVGTTLCHVGVDERAALVAVTASRRGPFASALLGSAARYVTRHADRPILVCPHQPDPALRLGALCS